MSLKLEMEKSSTRESFSVTVAIIITLVFIQAQTRKGTRLYR